MQVKKDNLSPTTIKLTVTADQELLDNVKHEVLTHLGKKHVNLQGFRAGKAPLGLVEKNVDQGLLQSEFLESAVNRMYIEAANQVKLRPVAQPKVDVKKFVPFTTLEITAEVEAVGDIKLADYKAIKLAKPVVKVSAKEVDETIASLRTRAGERKEVKRAAKDGDEVVIDFAGTDAKTNAAISGADGKDYPLVLGSKSFIPGFEDNLIGVAPDEDKTFNVTFPKDYGAKALQSKEVTFATTVKKVREIVEPEVDDAFAAKVGPFKTVADLKADIKQQLQAERQAQADRDYESQLLEKIAAKSEVAIPKALVDEEIERQEMQERQNLAYRGQTWQEHLKETGETEEEHREKHRPEAELRVKAGLILAEVADRENINVTPEELEMQIQLYKGQYRDAAMQAELDKPENRREIASRIISEKTIKKLTGYATAA